MQGLIPFQWRGQFVLLSVQLNNIFGLHRKGIKGKFDWQKSFFQADVDYFYLKKDELRAFKRFARSIGLPVNFTSPHLYLWTKSGVVKFFCYSKNPAHIKIINDLLANYFDQNNPVQSFLHSVFGEVRTVKIDNQPWFSGTDTARALEYVNPRDALAKHVPEKFKRQDVAIRDAVGGTNYPTFINEAGLYKLVFKSKMPKAEEFSDWICEVVIPAISETGYYAAADNALLAEKDAKIASLRREVEYLRGRLQKENFVEYYVVYAMEMNNGTVKIGVTRNLTERIKAISHEAGLTVIKVHSSRFMPKDDAFAIEAQIKKTFADKCITGEFFAVDFAQARALIP